MSRKQRQYASSRVSSLSESVIREMTRLAERHGALNLAQGFPDFSTPAPIRAAAVRAIDADFNQYSSTWGSPNLRRAISEKAAWFNKIPSDPDKNVTVTCGSTEAMTATIMALSEPGDEVLMFEPLYENYAPATVFAGAKPRPVPLSGDFSLDEEALKSSFSKKTKLVILNTPHNPSGKVVTKPELRAVADLCRDYDCVAVTDEIYEHILYDGRKHVSLASLPGMADRTVTVSGVSKTYTATGWRIGYTIAEASLTDAIRKVHDYTTVCAPAPLQEASAFALRLPASFYEQLAKNYQKKRDLIVKGLRDVGFEFVTPEGAYYIYADFRRLSRVNDRRFANTMAVDCGVAVVPGSSFFLGGKKGRHNVRFSYSKKLTTLDSAVSKMRAFFR